MRLIGDRFFTRLLGPRFIKRWLPKSLFGRSLLIIILPGRLSIAAVALLGIGNAMLWPAIWPQALKGLKDKALARGSAVLIMGIAGGALLPLFYGWLAGAVNHRYAYLIMIPAFLYMLYYSLLGLREKES